MAKLTEAQRRVLTTLAEGGHIEERLVVTTTRSKGSRWRTYRPLYAADGETLVQELTKATLAALRAAGRVERYARPAAQYDQGQSYRITEAGRATLSDKGTPPAMPAPEQPRYTYSLYEWRPDPESEDPDDGESLEMWSGGDEAEAIAQYHRNQTNAYDFRLLRHEWRYPVGDLPEVVAGATYNDDNGTWE